MIWIITAGIAGFVTGVVATVLYAAGTDSYWDPQ